MEGLLFVVLNKQPNCYHIDRLKAEIVYDERNFIEYNDDNFSGFYDWLRDITGKIIGVRYAALERFNPALIKALKQLSYISFIHEKVVEIYFSSNERRVDDKTSNDQDFGICKVYVSSNSTFAVLFDIAYLTANEFLSIGIV